MSAEEQSADRTVLKTVLSLALPRVLTLIGANLLRTTVSLPFEAGDHQAIGWCQSGPSFSGWQGLFSDEVLLE